MTKKKREYNNRFECSVIASCDCEYAGAGAECGLIGETRRYSFLFVYSIQSERYIVEQEWLAHKIIREITDT